MTPKPVAHSPHPLHAAGSTYRETNCYTDVLIELLHSRGLEPVAGLGHVVRADFEGDQFTFFKMPQSDIETLFGIDIHEVQPVGFLPEQICRQVERGGTMLLELDSFFLPDTAATDYRRNHVKTTVAVETIDQASGRMRYFHNTGLHELRGDDYRGVFGIGGRAADMLPPYLEVVRFDAGEPLAGDALRAAARELLRRHLARRPPINPFAAFGEQLEADLPALLEAGPETFHAYAFATVRMAGAAFDLLRAHLGWLLNPDIARTVGPIVEGCQLLSFRLARRRPFNPAPVIHEMAAAWDGAMPALERAVA